MVWRKNLLCCHTQSVIIFYSYEFDEDDFEEEIMPIPKKRAALKKVQDEEVVKPEPKKAKSEAKKAKPEAKKPALKNVQEEKEEVEVKPEATKAKPPAKKKGRKK